MIARRWPKNCFSGVKEVIFVQSCYVTFFKIVKGDGEKEQEVKEREIFLGSQKRNVWVGGIQGLQKEICDARNLKK